MTKKNSASMNTGPDGITTIVIVDDHPMVRHGLAQLINNEPDLQVVGEAEGAPQAIDIIRNHRPALAVIDISLKEGDGIELVQTLKAIPNGPRTLITSMHDETLYAERALHAGAMGYLNKGEATEEVVAAIRQILKGKIYLSERMSDRMLMQVAEPRNNAERNPIERLSNRELQVFQLIGEGQSTRHIAEHLHLSIKTIETHRASIKRKLNLETASELTRHAVQWVLEESSQNARR